MARYERRALLWAESDLDRVRKCGRTRHDAQGVAVRARGGVAGYAGVITCGSVWAEPVCNAKIMARRAVEIGAAVALWQSQGHQTVFSTLTMRHHRDQPLATLWDALATAWGKVTAGKGWVTDKGRHGVAGWLRVVEVTHGANGWHVHVHALLFLERKATPTTVAQLHRSMFDRWSRALVRAGLAAPLLAGQDARLITGPADADLAGYFTKATDPGHRLGLEFTQTQSKSARGRLGTHTPWRFLDLVHDGDADALDRWHEWERASLRKKQMTWAHGFRARLSLGAERSDDEIAGEEIGTTDDTLVVITPEGWDVLCRRPADLAHLLAAAETGGLTGVRVFLDARAVPYAVAAEMAA